MRSRLGILLSALTVPLVSAQPAVSPAATPNPCLVAEQTQLSFWLGEWELTWPGEKQGEVDHGTNSIQRVLDGCALEENFSGGTAMHLRGRSLSIFDTISGKWKQTWVDNEGGYLDFAGEFRDWPSDSGAGSGAAQRSKSAAAHGLQEHHVQRAGLELGSLDRWRQDLAGQLADSLQEEGLVDLSQG